METAIGRLKTLTVADVMTRGVFQLSMHETMDEAALALTKRGLTAAPVVDELGHCVGMLSASDFLHRQGQTEFDGVVSLPGEAHCLVNEAASSLHIDLAGRHMVSGRMSTDVKTVPAEASLLAAAQLMCDAHVHHLPVLDDGQHVEGVLSALDLVAALLQSIDESADVPSEASAGRTK